MTHGNMNSNQTLLSRVVFLLVIGLLGLASCESDSERRQRWEQELKSEEERAKLQAEAEERARQEAEALRMRQAEEAQRLEMMERFGRNRLGQGDTPWKGCFGYNAPCDYMGCSEIVVKAPVDDDVMVIIKKAGVVKKHAYIRAGLSYSFQMPDGVYQPYFYYGQGWWPDKEMDSKLCSDLKGGFLTNESWSKDVPRSLRNEILTYTLQYVYNGNLDTEDSNQQEAL